MALRKLDATDSVKNPSKLPSTRQPYSFLNAPIDPVVLLDVQPQRVQRLLGDANLATDTNDCRPVNDRHGADESVRRDRHKQTDDGGQRENCKSSRVLSHRLPFDSSKTAKPTPLGDPC